MLENTTVERRLARATDQPYFLGKGKSLAKVAMEAYGTPRLWRSIYEHNRETLGRNPRKMPTNVAITVPSLSTIIARNRSRTQVLMAFEACKTVDSAPN